MSLSDRLKISYAKKRTKWRWEISFLKWCPSSEEQGQCFFFFFLIVLIDWQSDQISVATHANIDLLVRSLVFFLLEMFDGIIEWVNVRITFNTVTNDYSFIASFHQGEITNDVTHEEYIGIISRRRRSLLINGHQFGHCLISFSIELCLLAVGNENSYTEQRRRRRRKKRELIKFTRFSLSPLMHTHIGWGEKERERERGKKEMSELW